MGSQKKRKIVILGAGLAGLSAAWKLSEEGHGVTVIEKRTLVGGLCDTAEYKNFLFDFGGHRFITKNENIIKEIKELMGSDFWTNQRKTQYFLWHKYLNYPLELKDLILKINPLISARAVADYFWTVIKNKIKPMPEDSFEDWTVKRFGRTLYTIFFGQYTEKFWGISPKQIDKEWASQRISLLNLWDVFKKLIIKPKNEPRTYTNDYYYCTYGIGQIAEKMAEVIRKNGGKIYLGAKILDIKHNSSGKIVSVRFQSGEEIKEESGDYFLSTIPINALINYLTPTVSVSVKKASDALRFRSLVFLNILINQERVTDNDAFYIPEPKYFFTRMIQYKLWSGKMAPNGKTSLQLEMGCFFNDEIWNMSAQELYAKCLPSLRAMGLIKDEKIILDYFSFKGKEVYPLLKIGYRENISAVRNYLNTIDNLAYFGRQGNFQYIHMHHVIEMGFRATQWIDGLLPREEINKIGTGAEYFG
ncbi:MAG: FAD-dependent oxidoreductase [Minisyncoccia bacterium]